MFMYQTGWELSGFQRQTLFKYTSGHALSHIYSTYINNNYTVNWKDFG